jgi:hypothetical protein
MLKGDSRDIWSVEEWTRGKVLRGWGPVSVGIVSGVTRRRSCQKMPLHPVVADEAFKTLTLAYAKAKDRLFHPYFPTVSLYIHWILKARIQLAIAVGMRS